MENCSARNLLSAWTHRVLAEISHGSLALSGRLKGGSSKKKTRAFPIYRLGLLFLALLPSLSRNVVTTFAWKGKNVGWNMSKNWTRWSTTNHNFWRFSAIYIGLVIGFICFCFRFCCFSFFFVCVICFCRCTKEKRGKTRRLPRRVEMWNQRVSKLNQNWAFKDFYDWFYTESHTPKTEAEWHRKRSCPAKGAETSRGTLSEKWAFAASWAPPFPLPPLNPRQNPAGCFLFGGLY